MQKAVLSAGIIISRAGYTTVMDLTALKKKAILIPTPGQTEQEYLSEYLSDAGCFVFCKQSDFNLNTAIKKLNDLKPDFSGFDDSPKESFIEIIIKNTFCPDYYRN